MRRPAIFLADLLTALDVLEVNDRDTAGRIAGLLGIGPVAERDLPRKDDAFPGEPAPVSPRPDEPPTAEWAVPDARPSEPVVQSSRFIPSELRSDLPSETPPTLRLRSGDRPLLMTRSEREEPRLPLIPLLRTSSIRAIVGAALSTEMVGDIDVSRTVGMLARREPLRRIPSKTIRTVHRGVQLLLDKGPGMMPCFRDQEWLSGWITRVIGRQQTEVAWFVGVPQRGLRRRLRRVRPYRPPPAGTPIVLLTDLGIAETSAMQAAGVAAWLDFAALARRAGCPVVAFVPYPVARWPRELRTAMTILRWDRDLTASRAAKLVLR